MRPSTGCCDASVAARRSTCTSWTSLRRDSKPIGFGSLTSRRRAALDKLLRRSRCGQEVDLHITSWLALPRPSYVESLRLIHVRHSSCGSARCSTSQQMHLTLTNRLPRVRGSHLQALRQVLHGAASAKRANTSVSSDPPPCCRVQCVEMCRRCGRTARCSTCATSWRCASTRRMRARRWSTATPPSTTSVRRSSTRSPSRCARRALS